MKLMISCLKATELVEKNSLFGLSLIELFELRIHNYICKGCKLYETQSKYIDEMLIKKFSYNSLDYNIHQDEIIKNVTNEKLKEKILNKL